MESRYNVRIPLRMNVRIRYPGREVFFGKTRDISFEGTYIESGDVPPLTHAFVRLTFLRDNGTELMPFELPAVIVRTEEGGMGLMFGNCESEFFDSLSGLLHERLQDMSLTSAAMQPAAG